MTTINYYSGYADHMWRFYIRNKDTDIETMTGPDRANWTACDFVFNRLRQEWKTVVQLYYIYYPRITDREDAVRTYCTFHDITIATVGTIIRAVQTMAAEERGLVSRKPKRYHGKLIDPLDQEAVTDYSEQG